jgi:hypothetical protein
MSILRFSRKLHMHTEDILHHTNTQHHRKLRVIRCNICSRDGNGNELHAPTTKRTPTVTKTQIEDTRDFNLKTKFIQLKTITSHHTQMTICTYQINGYVHPTSPAHIISRNGLHHDGRFAQPLRNSSFRSIQTNIIRCVQHERQQRKGSRRKQTT